MHHAPRQRLSELIAQHGHGLCDDAKRLEGMLKDVLRNEHKRETFAILNAIREGIARDLLSAPPGMPMDALKEKLVHRLCENIGLDGAVARWSVETWSIALAVKNPLAETSDSRIAERPPRSTSNYAAKQRSDGSQQSPVALTEFTTTKVYSIPPDGEASRSRLATNGRSVGSLVPGTTIGIDLGTTYSAVAHLECDGTIQATKRSDGRTITPSVVLLAEDGKAIVGPSFEQIAVEDPSHVIEAIKREIGNSAYFVIYQGRKLTPEMISALILKKLAKDAVVQIGPIANVVISVPHYFNRIRREATLSAGKVAGLNVVGLVNEATAAGLAYAWERGELGRAELQQPERTVLVYDLGGGTFDVAVVRYAPTHFKVLATDGDVMLGGLDWTRRVVDHVSAQFKSEFGVDPREDPETLQALSQDCELVKRELSQKAQTQVSVYCKGNSLTVVMTRGVFERITADLLQRTRDTTELVLQYSGVGTNELDDLILVGGSTYMPIVKKMLTEVAGRPPSRILTPETAVARGTSIYGAILAAKSSCGPPGMSEAITTRLRCVSIVDVNSHSLGVKIRDPGNRTRCINHVIIPRNTALPVSVKQQVATSDQEHTQITVLEGDALDPDACEVVGTVSIGGFPRDVSPGSQLEITYSCDEVGQITVTARDITSGRIVPASFN